MSQLDNARARSLSPIRHLPSSKLQPARSCYLRAASTCRLMPFAMRRFPILCFYMTVWGMPQDAAPPFRAFKLANLPHTHPFVNHRQAFRANQP